ncbi:hypothetical protein AJ78_02907 [Emergomyces pasteurianus Ep9510]|uniref:Homeobox domain-containing protein n=1 Tax=Emergomyces pasteurianus Ep9510 TaxID=1447872 RepID=A0A1J9QNZ0_9EURO|nr:hypothetical protein AJ78_02907 [Emergomyces pasteurianus Ep9510]
MSDPDESSLPAGVPEPAATTTSSGDATNNHYAFLVHSQKTLTLNLPPRVDNKALARQKRRRTSPDDQKILEAEYQRNPKPDRATRAEIVNRVTLGEKEVQIWFQNRRQNDRRRSKPLNPEDFRAPKPSGSDQGTPNGGNPVHYEDRSTLSSKSSKVDDVQTCNATRTRYTHISPNSSFGSGMGDESGGTFGSSQPSDSQVAITSQADESLSKEVAKREGHACTSEKGVSALIDQQLRTQPVSRKRSRSEPETTDTSNKHSPPTSSTFIPPSLRISLSFDGEAVVRKEGENTPSPQKPLDSIRISLSADGEALIRAANEESPTKNSPALLHNTRPAFGGLRRSISAFPLGSLKGIKEQQDPRPFGRSRDSRNWELYCDTDARTALLGSKNSILSSTSQTGNLSRRKSDLAHSRKALMPRTNLPNTLPLSEEPRGKRKKISRAMSSLARLESGHRGSTTKVGEGSIDFCAGDSDKENWIPGTQMSAARRAPKKQRSRRAVLQKPNRIGDGQNTKKLPVADSNKTQRGFGGGFANPNPSPADEDGNDGTEKSNGRPDELSRLSQDEDLDCIQGLLSLSQGAWK